MFSPASERNKQPILDELIQLLPSQGTVLELACGSMQHAQYFASHFSQLEWLPTDVSHDALAHGKQLQHRTPNLAAPFYLDVTEIPWQVPSIDVVYAANLLHISEAHTAPCLFEGAHQAVKVGGQIVIYGPFKIGGQHTAPSNAQFDADLRSRNAAWGIRDLAEIEAHADRFRFKLTRKIAMPANNFLLSFSHQGESA